ncbi:F-box/LRR-repeat protein At3g58900-like isoform X3 [Olea europaea var. sylvestris]|uniref:F-box/LRR-repeat protein At3g58900-like isoform X3 n=1 Tax=Olea europaea var. sylvestris TaxID=158386 RepID=UPI000C1D2EC7|nr:F-box/LRR-repeat protein At3g58900-like isoform X3 [Olea europaea var. sylvestris]
MIGSFKQQKVSENQNIDNGDDKMSHLPDCILHHILSFLPTKEAVATCILSKRWKFLWTSVPSIDFDDSLLYSSRGNIWHSHEVIHFMNFVERVLLLRDASSIKKFRLSCRVCFSASHVHEWVSAAIGHNVQELDLCLFVDEPFMLPSCVFDNASLKTVKFEMNCILQLPTYISFPCLQKLQLCLVTFPKGNSMQKLFSSCPSLEELAVLDCEWMNLSRITISIPSLKSLTIDDLPFCSVDDLRGCEIKIDAGNLTFFKYSGYLSNEIHLCDLSSSAFASIHIPIIRERRWEVACRTVKLFGGLKNISSLRISSGTIKCLFLADDVLDHIPMFQNLTHLELSRGFENNFIGVLLEFLQFLPKLESLMFLEGVGTGEGDYMPKSVPDCVLSTLKMVNFQKFQGCNPEMRLLKFLLKNALVLEKINLFCSQSLSGDLENQKKIGNQLRGLSIGSKHCTLAFM